MAFPTDIDIETKFDLTVTQPKFRLKNLTPYNDDAITLSTVKGNFKIVNPLGITVYNNVSTVTPDLASFSITSITRSGTTATATCATSHGMSTGDWVMVAGAAQSDYNILAEITKVSATVFTYQVENGPVTPATGTLLGLRMSLNSILIPTQSGTSTPIEGTYVVTLTTIIASGPSAGTYVNPFTYTYSYTSPTVTVSQSVNCFIPRYISTDTTTYTVGGIAPTISRTHNIIFPTDSELPTQTGTAQTIIINSPKVWNGTYTTQIITYLTYTNTDDLVIYDRVSLAQPFVVTCDINLCSVNCCLNTLNAQYESQKTSNPTQAQAILAILNRALQLSDLFTMNLQCGNSEAANENLQAIYAITGCTEDCACEANGQVVPLNGYVGHTIFDWTDYEDIGLNQYDYTNFENSLYQAIENVNAEESPQTNPEKYNLIGGGGYKVYSALLTQSGTSAPTATVLQNTTGYTFTFAYDAVGQYHAISSGGALGQTSVAIITNNSDDTVIMYSYIGGGSGYDFAYFHTSILTAGTPVPDNGVLVDTFVEIRIYPA